MAWSILFVTYASLLSTLTALAILRRPWRFVWLRFILKFVLRYLLYPLVKSRWEALSFSWLQLLTYITYWGLSITCAFVGLNDSSTLGDRSALIAVTNIFPGLLTSSAKFATKSLGLPTEVSRNTHILCGLGTLTFGVLHAALALAKNPGSPFSSNLFATLSGIILVVLTVIVLPPCRRRFPFFSAYSHQAFGLSLVFCLYFHMGDASKPPAVFLMTVAIIYGLMFLLQSALTITQLIRRAPSTASFDENGREKSFLNLEIRIRGAPTFEAGDVIWIYPRTSWYLKGFRVPIAWSTVSSEQGISTTLLSFVNRDSSLGQYLDGLQYKDLEVGVLGPFGTRTRLDKYGTVMLLATDLGIVPQLFHFKQILNKRNDGHTRTVAVVLVWHITNVDAFIYEIADNIEDMMQQTQTSIHVRIFSPYIERIQSEIEFRRKDGKSLDKLKGHQTDIYHAGEAPWQELIAKTVPDKAGSMLVLASTDHESRAEIRRMMSRIGQHEIRYMEIEN